MDTDHGWNTKSGCRNKDANADTHKYKHKNNNKDANADTNKDTHKDNNNNTHKDKNNDERGDDYQGPQSTGYDVAVSLRTHGVC